MRPKRYPPLSLAKQYHALAASPVCPGRGGLGMGRLTWEFTAQPSPLSRIYLVRMIYSRGSYPKVFVVDPDLTELAQGKELPHVYQQKPPQLCLYFPRTREWSPEMWLHKTLVPWAFLWLFFFEVWLATGEWKGGGIHPRARNENKKNSGN